MSKSFGARLKAARVKAGMTQREVAAKLGYHPQNSGSINRFENAHTGISKENIDKIVELFPELDDRKGKTGHSSYRKFGAAFKSAREAAGMGKLAASRAVGYAASGSYKIEAGRSGPSEAAYARILEVFPALKDIPPPVFTHRVGRGPGTKNKAEVAKPVPAKVPGSVTKVKRVLDAARQSGATPKKERQVSWTYVRSIIALMHDPELKGYFTTLLKAGLGCGLELQAIINDLESL